jgi:DNA-binding CsgD family transcriptional regulator
VLLGRSAEIARIDELLRAALGGRAAALMLTGPPGIGKSALIALAHEHAGPRFRRISVIGARTESTLSYAGLVAIVRSLLPYLELLDDDQAALLRGVCRLGPRPPVVDRLGVQVALLLLLAGAAEKGPILLTADDAQFLDTESRDAILFVTRRLDSDAVAVLLAMRADPGVVAGLGQDLSTPRMQLLPLDTAGVIELVLAVSGTRPSTAVAAALQRATGGNPLALVEVANRLNARQLEGAEPLPRALPMTASAQQAYAHRLAQLTPELVAALEFLALADGDPVDAVLSAAQVVGVAPEVISELEAQGLVRLAGGTIQLAHGLLTAAVLARIPPGRQRAGHRVLAQALTGTPVPGSAVRRAWHLADSVTTPDGAAADALAALAADQDRIGNWAAAARAGEWAARLTPQVLLRAKRFQDAADAAALAGYVEASLRLLDSASAESDDPLFRAGLDHARGVRHIMAGRPRTAWDLLPAAGEVLMAADPKRAALVLTDASMAAFLAGRPEQSRAVADRALALSSEPEVVASASLVAGLSAVHLGDLAGGLDLLRQVSSAGSGGLLPEGVVEYVAPLTVGLVWAGRFTEAARLADGTIDGLSRSGALGLLPAALYSGAYVSAWRGDLNRALVRATAGHEAAQEAGNLLWLRLCTGGLALTEVMRGDLAAGRRWADQAQRLDAELEVQQPRDADDALGLAALCAGEADEARRHLERAHRAGPDTALVFGRPTGVDLVEAYVRSGRDVPDDFAAGLAAALRSATSTPAQFPVLAAQVWRCSALIGTVDPDEGFAAALAHYGEIGLPWQEARTRLSYGEFLRRSGRRVAARAELRLALDFFARTGCSAWAERAGAELATAGGSVPHRGPNPAADLTAQELNVALAVAGGATNREVSSTLFLSAKTVEMHLTRIYRKLGLRSRTELAARFARAEP